MFCVRMTLPLEAVADTICTGVHELNGKRQRRATEFVFTRQSIPLAANDGLGPAQQAAEGEGARRIKPLPRSSGQSSVAAPPETVTGATVLSGKQREETRDTNNDLTSQLDLDSDSEITSLQIAQHRRFHISRTSVARGRQSPVIGGKIQKRAPTVFVERRPQTPNSRGEKPRVKAEPRPSTTRPATIDQLEAPRRQKKPGRSARTTPRSTSQPPGAQLAPTSTSRDRNIRLPSGLTTPWDVTSEQLAKELEAYTLEEIGRNIAESSVTGPQPPSRLEAPSQPGESVSFRIKKGTPSKFKPKMPAQRYRDRHPEAAAPAAEMEGDRDLTDDDSDFVIDTYVRMPAEDVKVADKNHVGYIVLEDQPDIDEFYEEDDQQNEEDEEYDEDDENGMFASAYIRVYCIVTDALQLRTITRQTIQMKRLIQMMSMIATRTATVMETLQTKRSLMRMTMMRWMRTMMLLPDTPGSNRASPLG